MSDELERIWKGTAVAKLKALFQHLLGRTNDKHKIPQ
jgi:hypothetical protein